MSLDLKDSLIKLFFNMISSGRIEMMDESVNGGAESTELEPMEVTGADDQEPKKRIVGTFKVSSTVTTEKGALPKWFKPAK